MLVKYLFYIKCSKWKTNSGRLGERI